MAKTKKRQFNINIGRISLIDKALFTKHLAVMLGAGLTINEALDVTADEAVGKFKIVLEDMKEQVIAGKSLADTMQAHAKVFSELYISIVRVGEKSGTLVESLNQLAVQLEKEHQLRNTITQAMLYPIIVLIAIILVGGGISIFVLPKLQSMFDVFQGELPLATKILLWIVDVLINYGIYIFFGSIILIIFLIWFLRLKSIKPYWHALLLKIPIIKPIIKNINLARFNRGLGTLLKSGLPITESLHIVANTMDNEVYKKSINEVLAGIKEGNSMNSLMRPMDKVFPKITSRMIDVGEKSGKLEEVLIFLAKFYESEVDKSSKNLSTTLEPVLLIIIGLIVGFVVIAIITPIYQLTSTIGEQTN